LEFGLPGVLVKGPTQRLGSFGHLWSDFPAAEFAGSNTPTSVDSRPLTVKAPSYENNSSVFPLGSTNAKPAFPLIIGDVTIVVYCKPLIVAVGLVLVNNMERYEVEDAPLYRIKL
jgi:hypothetical protein